MAFEFSRNTLRLGIEYHNCAIDPSCGEEVAFAIEAHARRMTATETTSRGFRVVLRKYKGIDQGKIHVDGMLNDGV